MKHSTLSQAVALDKDPDGSQQTTPAAIPPSPESALNWPYNCPRHQTPPPKPTQLLFPAKEANQSHLQMQINI